METKTTYKDCLCVICGEDDESKFYLNAHKSLCKKHYGITRTPSVKKAILKKFSCIFCGDRNKANYHPYCKNKCKAHYSRKSPPKEKKPKRKIVVVNAK